jgi:translation initiation factor 1
MSKKNNLNSNGFVYSTNPNFSFEEEKNIAETLPPTQQKLKIKLDAKRRAGKVVTLVIGFIGTEADATELGKQLKTICGTGGSVKDREIIVQGDHREKVLQWLLKNSYTATKKI